MATSMDTSMRRRRIRPLPASSTASSAIGSSGPAISALDREAENAENRLLQLQLELGDPFSTNTVDLSSRNALEGLVETVSSVDTASRTHRRVHTAPEAPLQETLVRDTAVANEDSAYLDFTETDVSDYSWPLYDSSTGSWVSAESDLSRQDLETLPPIAQSNRPRLGHLREAVSTSRSVPNLHLPSGQQWVHGREVGSSATASTANRYKRNTTSQPQRSHPHLSASSSQTDLAGNSRSVRSTTSAPTGGQAASQAGATTSAWRHIPPTSSTIARRPKRRRSISNSSEQPDATTQVPSRRVSARSHASNDLDSVGASANHPETSESGSLGEYARSAERRVSSAHPDADHASNLRFPSFSLDLPSLPSSSGSSEASNLSRYIENLMAAEQMSQSVATTSLRDLLDPPPPALESQQPRPPLVRQSSSSFANRRGNDAGLSLGTLPQFHFNPIFDEGLISPLTSVNQGSASAISPNANSSGSSSRRRPHLQRNATAVSPPEESPLNSPEFDMRLPRSQASTATSPHNGRSAEHSFFVARRRASPPPVRANWRRDSDLAPSEDLLGDLERTRSVQHLELKTTTPWSRDLASALGTLRLSSLRSFRCSKRVLLRIEAIHAPNAEDVEVLEDDEEMDFRLSDSEDGSEGSLEDEGEVEKRSEKVLLCTTSFPKLQRVTLPTLLPGPGGIGEMEFVKMLHRFTSAGVQAKFGLGLTLAKAWVDRIAPYTGAISPCLSTLNLVFMDWPHDARLNAWKLPNLVHLDMQIGDATSFVYFLRNLDAPRLQKVCITSVWDMNYDGLRELLGWLRYGKTPNLGRIDGTVQVCCGEKEFSTLKASMEEVCKNRGIDCRLHLERRAESPSDGSIYDDSGWSSEEW